MIASTLMAAALAAQPAPAVAPAAHDHSAMTAQDHKAMTAKPAAAGKMEGCCKDGCSCCAKKDAAKS